MGKRVTGWLDAFERRYTYRVPTAIVCTCLLLFGTALWGLTGGPDRAATQLLDDYALDDFDDGDDVAARSGDEGDEDEEYVDPETGATLRGEEARERRVQREGPAAAQQQQQQQERERQQAEAREVCPEGLDQGVCTGITADAIRLGFHAATSQCGTPLPDTAHPDEAEADTWFQYINEVEGGIHGRQLENFEADDGYCPEMAGQAARELIDDHRVFSAQGYLGVDQNRTVAEHAHRRGVPYMAGGGPHEWTDRWAVFHQSQSGYDLMYPAVLRYIISPQGLNRPNARIGMMFVNTPDVRLPTERAFAAVPEANAPVKIPLNQGIKQDFSSEIAEMVGEQVEVVYCNCHPLNMVSFVQQADAQGFRPQYTFVSQGYDLDIIYRLMGDQSSWRANAKGLSNFCHPSHPCHEPYVEKLRQVNPNVRVSQLSLVGIHAVELWAEPLRRAGRNVNRAIFTQHLRGLNGWTAGITAPMRLSPERWMGAQGFAVYHSPGIGQQSYRMVDAEGQAFRNW